MYSVIPMIVSGVQNWISQEMVMLLSDSFLLQTVKIYRVQECLIIDFRGQVAGISKTL